MVGPWWSARCVLLIKAPLCAVELSRPDIAGVEVGPDPGLNAGLLT